MKQLTVTTQQELDDAINENVHAEILLNGDIFTLPKSGKIHDLTFIGSRPQTTVYLTTTYTESKKYDPKVDKVADYKAKMVEQFDTVFSARCKNLTVTSAQETELYFQTTDELEQWSNVTFDKNMLEVVIFEDELFSIEEKERMFEIEEGLKEVGKLTVEFIESIQDSFNDLLKAFK